MVNKIFLVLILISFGGCQRVSQHSLWKNLTYHQTISIHKASFLKKRGVNLEYSLTNELSQSFYVSRDLRISNSSHLGYIEIKNAFGMKAEVFTTGFRLADQEEDEILPKKTVKLSIKRWQYPIWYPSWFPGQKVRISTEARKCKDKDRNDNNCRIVLTSEWVKIN